MSATGYKKTLKKWAAARNGKVKIVTQKDAFPGLGDEERYTACVSCTLTGLCIYEEKLQDETEEECEQRAARRFLATFAGSPLGLVR